MQSAVLYEEIKYVDRDSDVDDIIRDIGSTKKSKIRIITSKTAVGKTSVSLKTFTNKLIDKYHKLCIKTNPENCKKDVVEWQYLDHIFDAIAAYFESESARQKDLSFDHYVFSVKDPIIRREILDIMINGTNPQNGKLWIVWHTACLAIKGLLKLDKFNSYNIIGDRSEKTRRIKIHYLRYVFNKCQMLINIDNIQNIDFISLNSLTSLISESQNNRHYFLFEFTISEEHGYDTLLKLSAHLGTGGVDVHIHSLANLPIAYAIDVVTRHVTELPKDLDFSINLLHYYKSTSSGNLRQLIDYSLNYSKTSVEHDISNATLMNLKSLSSEAKYLLALIVLNNGKINIDMAIKISQQRRNSNLDIRKYLEELEVLKIASSTHDVFCTICHASIIDEWRKAKDEFNVYDVVAYNDFKKYLCCQLGTINPDDFLTQEQIWLQLISMYSQYQPHQIIGLYDYVKKNIFTSLSPQNAWKYIKQFIDVTKCEIKQYEEMYLDILQFCFTCELYNEGYECINLLEEFIDYKYVKLLVKHKAMYLSALDKHLENIEYCRKNISIFENDTNIILNLHLILLSSYRSLGLIDECHAIFNEIYGNSIYEKCDEYGYFLRLTDVFLPRNESVKYAKKSVTFFKKRRLSMQMGKSLITYSYLLASMGRCKLALKIILQAETVLFGTRIGAHMILVNKAAIKLLSGFKDDSIWEDLDKAEASAVVPFDKLAIANNKLIWSIENNNYTLYKLLTNQIIHLIPQEPDKHIVAVSYYNLYIIYEQMGESVEANKYLGAAIELQSKSNLIKARLSKKANKETFFLLSKPWHVCFLAYWTFDIIKQ